MSTAPERSAPVSAFSTYAGVGVGVVGGIVRDRDVAELGAARVDRVGLVAVEALELRAVRLEEADEVVKAPKARERGRVEDKGVRNGLTKDGERDEERVGDRRRKG